MSRLLSVLVRALLLLGAVLLPAAWPPGLARPDLALLVVAAVALLHRPSTGLLVGLAAGWLVDLVPPGAAPLGAGALTYAAVGAGLSLSRRVTDVSPLLPWVFTGLAAAAVLAVRWVASAAGAGRALAPDLLWTWAMTMLVAVVALPVLMHLERRLTDRSPA